MNAIIKLAEEKIESNTRLQTFVQEAKQHAIVLFPETVQFVDPALKFGAAVVSVNTAMDQYGNNKDIYKNETGGYCLHLSKLNEIAQTAGIQIIDSRVLDRKTDDTGRVVYINHQVTGRMKAIDGSLKQLTTTGKYDYHRDLQSLGKGDPSNKQVNARRKHAEALAESNAITRLYNKLMAKLPTSFTLDELKKPFLIPFVIEDRNVILNELPEADRIQIKKELAMKRLGLADQIYSNGNGKPKEEEAIVTMVEDDPEEEAQSAPAITPAEVQKYTNKQYAEEYRDVPQEHRTKKMMDLIKATGYKDPKGAEINASRIGKMPLDAQIKFLEILFDANDKNNDLPF